MKLCLQLARVLQNDLHQGVGLAGYLADSPESLSRTHGVDNWSFGPVYHSERVGVDMTLPVKLTAYGLLMTRGFKFFVRKTIEDFEPDELWFNDDIPAAAAPFLEGRRVFLYVHFPFMARTSEYVSKSLSEAASEWVVRRRMERLIMTKLPAGVTVIANSTVTAEAVRRIWGVSPMVLAPYIYESAVRPQAKEHLVVSLGALQSQKRHLEAFTGFKAVEMKQDHWQFKVVGHSRDSGYARTLRALGVGVVENPSRQVMDGYLAKAMIVVNAATFEPFGLTLCEAMANGCQPLVQISEVSGSWTDVLERGRYGTGFRDTYHLRELLGGARYGAISIDPEAARARASSYSREDFVQRLRTAVN